MLQLPRRPAKRLALLALAAFFVAAGVNHFLNPDFYVRIMPPCLPAHLELVYLSGLFEVLGGMAVLLPAVRALAGWGLILLLVAVYPANLHMALHPELFPEVSPAALYARLPLQLVFVAWAYWATRPEPRAAAAPPFRSSHSTLQRGAIPSRQNLPGACPGSPAEPARCPGRETAAVPARRADESAQNLLEGIPGSATPRPGSAVSYTLILLGCGTAGLGWTLLASDPSYSFLRFPDAVLVLASACWFTAFLRIVRSPAAPLATGLLSIALAAWIPFGTAAFLYWLLRVRHLERSSSRGAAGDATLREPGGTGP